VKRSADLQSLSREHHTALVLAKACERAADSGDAEQVGATCERAIHAFADELEPHFLIEEQVLLPLLNDAEMPLVERTLADHRHLRGLLKGMRQNNVNALADFAKGLSAHVRFEERELFPALERASGGG
jgi:iron-sulfur cluster repair protein YtfE (RIC family)